MKRKSYFFRIIIAFCKFSVTADMYPINICMKGCQAAIFGGGAVALRKLGRLLEEGAKVVLVAPELVPELQELMESLPEERLVWHQMTHRDFDWEASDFRLVFAATDSREANHEIGQMAHGHGALVNDITAPEECDFQVPARICRGQLELTASTGGASPAFARMLRQDLENRYHEGFGQFLDWLGEMRRELWRREPNTVKRQGLWRQAMTPEIFNYILDERLEQAKNEIRRKIGCAGAESSDSSCGDSRKI